MSQLVNISNGSHRGAVVTGTFPLVKPFNGKHITVRTMPGKPFGDVIKDSRILVDAGSFQLVDDEGNEWEPEKTEADLQAEFAANETDEEAMARIEKSFVFLEKFTDAAQRGIVTGLVVTGPPGCGKSHGVMEVLAEANTANELRGLPPMFEALKGSVSASMLYRKLFEFSESGQVLVLDDCEVFDDIEAMNLLKAALDSCDKRMISWMKDAAWLATEDIPNKFEFKGSIIFLTNVDFALSKGKKAAHLSAIQSRVHYMDLAVTSERDLLLRIKQVIGCGMLKRYDFTKAQEEAIVSYVFDNASYLRELSLRCVVKLADLVQAFPSEWTDFADSTLLTNAAKYRKLDL